MGIKVFGDSNIRIELRGLSKALFTGSLRHGRAGGRGFF
jgi:hypothetical protein